MNYSELLQLAKGWSDFVSDRINIWRLPYFDYEGMVEMQLNPVLSSFDSFPAESHNINDCTVQKDEKENTTVLTVTGLPEESSYVYIQTEDETVFDLKKSLNKDNFCVTVDNSVNLDQIRIIAVDTDSSIRIMYE